MTRTSTLRASLLALAIAAGSADAPAQSAKPAPPPPFPGFTNEVLRYSDPAFKAWDLGVVVRLREEVKDDAGATKAGSNWDFSRRVADDNNNSYELSRVMPHLGYTGDLASFYVEGRSSYSFGDERFNPATAGQNLADRDGPLDLYQAYVTLGNPRQFPVTVKVGRQELAYGDMRLVGHSRWANVPRTFDALKVRYESPGLTVDAFTGAVVYARHDHLNKSNSQDLFSGLYVTLPQALPDATTELYLLARNVARGIATDDWSGVPPPARFPGAQDLYTVGCRVKSRPVAGSPWDYTAEADYQFGNRTAVFPATTVAAALAAPRLEQGAYALIATLGYSWPKGTPWSPRVAVTASLASGDDNPADHQSSTFQNLFPSNHGLYGAMDLTGLQNARDLRFSASVKPRPTLAVNLDVNLQALDSSSDFWYNAGGAPRNFTGAAAGSGGGYRINPGYGTSLGQEVDLTAAWNVYQGTLLEAGVGHYFRGTYIKESLAAVGSKDASYVYVQLTLNL